MWPARATSPHAARELVFDKYQPRYSGSLADWRVRSLPIAVDLEEEMQRSGDGGSP